MLLVLNAHGRPPERCARLPTSRWPSSAPTTAPCSPIVANRADPAACDAVVDALVGLDVPAFAIREEPLLSAPSVGDLMAACDGTLVSGEEGLLTQEATGVLVAAMTLPHVLDRLFDGAVVVTPGDRPEIVLGVLTAQVSANFPQMAGIVLNGGFPLPDQVRPPDRRAGRDDADRRDRPRHQRDDRRAQGGPGPARQGLAPQDRHRAGALRRAGRRRAAARPARGGPDPAS